MTSQNPTLLIGLGAFGRAVVARASPAGVRQQDEGDPAPGAEVMAVADDALEPAAVAGDAEARCVRLLDLGRFVDTTAPADPRGPRLDVLVVADLGEAPVAAAVAGIIETLARRLRQRFRPILRAGEGALAVCPLLLLPRGADAARCTAPVHALAALARHPDPQQRLPARIYLVEDQSGKYLLSPDELMRSFAAFLHLLLLSRLRDDQGVRDLVEPPDDDRVRPLGTFVCATIEVDMAAAHELCALALGREIVACAGGPGPALAEIAAEAGALVPEQTTVEGKLWQEGEGRTLESYLTPPEVPVPGIGWTDAPEDITERKLGGLWRLESARTIAAFRERVEDFHMDRLAAQIERNGAALAAEIEAEVSERARAEVQAGPRGPVRALELLRYAAARARALRDGLRARIDAPDLPRFPPSPLDARTDAVHEAAAAWPRQTPDRMRLLSAVAVVLGTLALGGILHMAAGLSRDLIADLIGRPLPWWASAAAGLALAWSGARYALWRHRKRHHNWLQQARDDLDQALARYLHRDVVDYFRRRLGYTRLLWSYRIYDRLTGRLDALAAQLEAGRAALAETERGLAAREHEGLARLARTGGAGPMGEGVLHRRLLQPAVVEAFYGHARPADVSATAARFHAEATAAADPLEAPFADEDRLLAFCRRELAHVRVLAPYEPARSPLADAVAEGVRAHLQKLALKLSPPLEVIQSAASEAPAPRRVVIAPPEARALIEDSLESLDQSWVVRSQSGDPQRIHLLVARGGLPVEAVAALAQDAGVALAHPGAAASPLAKSAPEGSA